MINAKDTQFQTTLFILTGRLDRRTRFDVSIECLGYPWLYRFGRHLRTQF